jgi:ribosomal protein S18 acetylase RimI-like enzyme
VNALSVEIRQAKFGDAPDLLSLIAEHIAFERSATKPPTVEKLREMLVSDDAPVLFWVALVDGELAGYLSATTDFSTWQLSHYLHMDCLYLSERCRGGGVGRQLMGALIDHAKTQGISEIQWQTPVWNEGAIGFYQRLGAVMVEKKRFSLII